MDQSGIGVTSSSVLPRSEANYADDESPFVPVSPTRRDQVLFGYGRLYTPVERSSIDPSLDVDVSVVSDKTSDPTLPPSSSISKASTVDEVPNKNRVDNYTLLAPIPPTKDRRTSMEIPITDNMILASPASASKHPNPSPDYNYSSPWDPSKAAIEPEPSQFRPPKGSALTPISYFTPSTNSQSTASPVASTIIQPVVAFGTISAGSLSTDFPLTLSTSTDDLISLTTPSAVLSSPLISPSSLSVHTQNNVQTTANAPKYMDHDVMGSKTPRHRMSPLHPSNPHHHSSKLSAAPSAAPSASPLAPIFAPPPVHPHALSSLTVVELPSSEVQSPAHASSSLPSAKPETSSVTSGGIDPPFSILDNRNPSTSSNSTSSQVFGALHSSSVSTVASNGSTGDRASTLRPPPFPAVTDSDSVLPLTTSASGSASVSLGAEISRSSSDTPLQVHSMTRTHSSSTSSAATSIERTLRSHSSTDMNYLVQEDMDTTLVGAASSDDYVYDAPPSLPVDHDVEHPTPSYSSATSATSESFLYLQSPDDSDSSEELEATNSTFTAYPDLTLHPPYPFSSRNNRSYGHLHAHRRSLKRNHLGATTVASTGSTSSAPRTPIFSARTEPSVYATFPALVVPPPLSLIQLLRHSSYEFLLTYPTHKLQTMLPMFFPRIQPLCLLNPFHSTPSLPKAPENVPELIDALESRIAEIDLDMSPCTDLLTFLFSDLVVAVTHVQDFQRDLLRMDQDSESVAGKSVVGSEESNSTRDAIDNPRGHAGVPRTREVQDMLGEASASQPLDRDRLREDESSLRIHILQAFLRLSGGSKQQDFAALAASLMSHSTSDSDNFLLSQVLRELYTMDAAYVPMHVFFMINYALQLRYYAVIEGEVASLLGPTSSAECYKQLHDNPARTASLDSLNIGGTFRTRDSSGTDISPIHSIPASDQVLHSSLYSSISSRQTGSGTSKFTSTSTRHSPSYSSPMSQTHSVSSTFGKYNALAGIPPPPIPGYPYYSQPHNSLHSHSTSSDSAQGTPPSPLAQLSSDKSSRESPTSLVDVTSGSPNTYTKATSEAENRPNTLFRPPVFDFSPDGAPLAAANTAGVLGLLAIEPVQSTIRFEVVADSPPQIPFSSATSSQKLPNHDMIAPSNALLSQKESHATQNAIPKHQPSSALSSSTYTTSMSTYPPTHATADTGGPDPQLLDAGAPHPASVLHSYHSALHLPVPQRLSSVFSGLGVSAERGDLKFGAGGGSLWNSQINSLYEEITLGLGKRMGIGVDLMALSTAETADGPGNTSFYESDTLSVPADSYDPGNPFGMQYPFPPSHIQLSSDYSDLSGLPRHANASTPVPAALPPPAVPGTDRGPSAGAAASTHDESNANYVNSASNVAPNSLPANAKNRRRHPASQGVSFGTSAQALTDRRSSAGSTGPHSIPPLHSNSNPKDPLPLSGSELNSEVWRFQPDDPLSHASTARSGHLNGHRDASGPKILPSAKSILERGSLQKQLNDPAAQSNASRREKEREEERAKERSMEKEKERMKKRQIVLTNTGVLHLGPYIVRTTGIDLESVARAMRNPRTSSLTADPVTGLYRFEEDDESYLIHDSEKSNQFPSEMQDSALTAIVSQYSRSNTSAATYNRFASAFRTNSPGPAVAGGSDRHSHNSASNTTRVTASHSSETHVQVVSPYGQSRDPQMSPASFSATHAPTNTAASSTSPVFVPSGQQTRNVEADPTTTSPVNFDTCGFSLCFPFSSRSKSSKNDHNAIGVSPRVASPDQSAHPILGQLSPIKAKSSFWNRVRDKLERTPTPGSASPVSQAFTSYTPSTSSVALSAASAVSSFSAASGASVLSDNSFHGFEQDLSLSPRHQHHQHQQHQRGRPELMDPVDSLPGTPPLFSIEQSEEQQSEEQQSEEQQSEEQQSGFSHDPTEMSPPSTSTDSSMSPSFQAQGTPSNASANSAARGAKKGIAEAGVAMHVASTRRFGSVFLPENAPATDHAHGSVHVSTPGAAQGLVQGAISDVSLPGTVHSSPATPFSSISTPIRTAHSGPSSAIVPVTPTQSLLPPRAPTLHTPVNYMEKKVLEILSKSNRLNFRDTSVRISVLGQGASGLVYKIVHVPSLTILAGKVIRLHDVDLLHSLTSELQGLMLNRVTVGPSFKELSDHAGFPTSSSSSNSLFPTPTSASRLRNSTRREASSRNSSKSSLLSSTNSSNPSWLSSTNSSNPSITAHMNSSTQTPTSMHSGLHSSAENTPRRPPLAPSASSPGMTPDMSDGTTSEESDVEEDSHFNDDVCPHIIRFYDAFVEPIEGCIVFVTEFMDGGTLEDFIDGDVCIPPDPIECKRIRCRRKAAAKGPIRSMYNHSNTGYDGGSTVGSPSRSAKDITTLNRVPNTLKIEDSSSKGLLSLGSKFDILVKQVSTDYDSDDGCSTGDCDCECTCPCYCDATTPSDCVCEHLCDDEVDEEMIQDTEAQSQSAYYSANTPSSGLSRPESSYATFPSSASASICANGDQKSSKGTTSTNLPATNPYPNGIKSEKVLANIAYGSLQGLTFLHKRSLIHRDIKLSNLLINHKGEVKISDFGIAKELPHPDALAKSHIGTLAYMSPERLVGSWYGTSSDVWSLGICLLVLALGKYPFGENVQYWELVSWMQNSPYFPPNTGFSPRFIDFVESMLNPDHKTRPSAEEMLTHPFLRPYVTSIRHREGRNARGLHPDRRSSSAYTFKHKYRMDASSLLTPHLFVPHLRRSLHNRSSSSSLFRIPSNYLARAKDPKLSRHDSLDLTSDTVDERSERELFIVASEVQRFRYLHAVKHGKKSIPNISTKRLSFLADQLFLPKELVQKVFQILQTKINQNLQLFGSNVPSVPPESPSTTETNN